MSEPTLSSILGPLAPYYEDRDVTEIMVDSPKRVLIERKGKLEDVALQFEPPESLEILIRQIMALLGAGFSEGETVKDFRLPDSRGRVMAVLPPTALDGPCLVIRKSIFDEITWEMLFQFGVMNQEMYGLLQDLILARANILVAGGTSSGKTTLMNRLAELIPATERVIIAEETHSYRIHHPRAVYLEASATGMPMKDLLRTATQMRPDRLVIGELYGEETLRTLEILNSGHDGSLLTLHALNSQDALTRLETMCLMANLGLGLSEIRSMIALAPQAIVYQKRLPDGKRRITEIVALEGLQDDQYVLQPLLRFDPESDRIELTGARPGFLATRLSA